MLPAMYKSAYKFFKAAKEDLKILFRYRLERDNLYALTEKTENTFEFKKHELKEWFYLVYLDDPVPFTIFFLAIIGGGIAMIYILFF